jgi:mgtE-like transporter
MTVYSTKRIMKESMPLLIPLVAIMIAGGQLLKQNEALLIDFPIFLVMIPVIISVGGNIGSILGARLSSGLHLGTIEIELHGKELRENVISAALLGIISYTSLTIFILIVSPLMGINIESNGANILLKAGYIMLGTGLLLTAIVIVISVFVARFSFENGFDPDNTVIPVVTTLCDVLGIVCLIIMIGVVGI